MVSFLDRCENMFLIYSLMLCFLTFSSQVLLKTSAGDIDIELWSKEAPKACRNFVQLCMEGKDLMNTNLRCCTRAATKSTNCQLLNYSLTVFDNQEMGFG